jgi:flavin reductase (DIM6/NTAB) family NADH-FMN oxidoreductase RutF
VSDTEDDDAFDALMEPLDAPMSVVTATVGDERAGCLIGFQSQCSINPRRYVMWLSKANHTYRVALRTEHLAVHFLDRADRELAELFGTLSGDDVDKFTRCQWEPGPEGVSLLTRCPNRMIVRRMTLLDDGSDHLCVVTEPVEVHRDGRFTPLRLSDVEDLVPGHTVDERPRPPTEREA